MKKILKYIILVLFLGFVGIVASCGGTTETPSPTLSVNPTSPSSSTVEGVTGKISFISATRNRVVVEVSLDDSKDKVTKSSVRAVLYDMDEDQISSQSCSDIPGYNEDGTVKTQKITFEDLSSNTKYVAKILCTIGDEQYTIVSKAVETNNTGSTSEDPIKLYTKEDLKMMADDLDACYSLEADIDFGTEESKLEWTPLFTSTSKLFEGEFNGNGHTVSNFMQKTSNTYYGLFGYVGPNAKISNLNIKNVEIKTTRYSTTYVGALAGYVEPNALIDNVHASNISIDVANSSSSEYILCVGGLVGANTGAGIINSSIVSSTIKTSLVSGGYVGGLVGSHKSGIEYGIEGCNVEVDIVVTQKYTSSVFDEDDEIFQAIGGVAGVVKANSLIKDTTVSGKITSTFEMNISKKEDLEKINMNNNVEIGGITGMNSGRISGVACSMGIEFQSFDAFKVRIGLLVGSTRNKNATLTDCAYIGTYKDSENLSATRLVKIVLAETVQPDAEPTEKNDFERSISIGVVGATDVTAAAITVYVVQPSLELNPEDTVYDFAGTIMSLTDVKLSESVLATVQKWV